MIKYNVNTDDDCVERILRIANNLQINVQRQSSFYRVEMMLVMMIM
jgi:hypothetical protein